MRTPFSRRSLGDLTTVGRALIFGTKRALVRAKKDGLQILDSAIFGKLELSEDAISAPNKLWTVFHSLWTTGSPVVISGRRVFC